MDHWALSDVRGKKKDGGIRTTLHPWWKKGVADPEAKIKDNVEHVLREHNQEVEHLANPGQRYSKQYEAIGTAAKQDGRIGCGVVIRAVERQNGGIAESVHSQEVNECVD